MSYFYLTNMTSCHIMVIIQNIQVVSCWNLGKYKRIRVFTLINIVLPLAFGGLIYVITRPDTYISQWVYRVLHLSISSNVVKNVLPRWLWLFLCNFSADILWAYSLTFAVYAIFHDCSRCMYLVFTVCILFEAGVEILQLFGILNGTFDCLDIAFEICATAIASLNIKHTGRKLYENI